MGAVWSKRMSAVNQALIWKRTVELINLGVVVRERTAAGRWILALTPKGFTIVSACAERPVKEPKKEKIA